MRSKKISPTVLREGPRRKSRSAAHVLAIILSIWVLACGCTRLQVLSRTPDGWREAPGFEVYGSKPYLLVYPAAGATGMAWRVIYLPDHSRTYSVSLRGWLGTRSYRLELTEGGTLQTVTSGPGGRAWYPETSSPALAQQIQTTLSGQAVGPQSSGLVLPAPGLYELDFDDATGALKQLRPVPFEMLRQESPPLVQPRVREIRFETEDSASPEAVTAIVLPLDFGSPAPCLPPGLSLSVVRDGSEVADLCQSDLLCQTSSSEVRCNVFEPKLHQYLVRVGTWDTVAGRRLDSLLEGRFPAAPEGFTPFKPTAEVSFGKARDGRVRTIAVHFDPRRGSCVDQRGDIEVIAEGVKLSTPSWQDQAAASDTWGGKCVQGTLLTLDRPYADISVSLTPKNQSGLMGDMVFASTAALPEVQKAPPVVVRVDASASGSTVQGRGGTPTLGGPKQNISVSVSPRAPGGKPNESKLEIEARITKVEGDLSGTGFRGFQIEFVADPRTVARGVSVHGWWASPPAVPYDDKSDRRVIAFRAIPCSGAFSDISKAPAACGQMVPLTVHDPSIRKLDSNQESSTYEADFDFTGTKTEAPRLLCFQLWFKKWGKDKEAPTCWVVTVDESLLGAETP